MKYKNPELKYNQALAEIVGVMLGDGCLYAEKRSNKFQTAIAFNKKEIDYLDYIKNLFENYFQYKFCISELKSEFLLRNNSVFVGEQLIEAGLYAGDKIRNGVSIPKWIFRDKNYLVKTVRGLFDTDGSVYRKYGKFIQIQFKFGCFKLTKSLHQAITLIGFNPTKLKKGSTKDRIFWKFYLARQKEIDKFFQEIKPANSKHFERYNKMRNGDGGI